MTRRLLLVLAIGAALVGAPSRVSAASNTLLGAQVTPTSGTTATTFAFTVRYEGRFGATGVAANAGPATVALVRISGTELDGTWDRVREEAAAVLGKCEPPGKPDGQTTGLVLGQVQSGNPFGFMFGVNTG